MFWREARLLHRFSLEEASSLASVFTELTRNMVILEPNGLERDILWIAASNGLTVYDASYIALARKHKLTLVTEDRKLLQAANGIVEVASLDDIA